MKKIISSLVLISLFSLGSCSEDEVVTKKVSGDQEPIVISDFVDFSLGLSSSLENPKVLSFLAEKASEEIDYDSNVLYTLVSPVTVDGKSVGDHIFDPYLKNKSFNDPNLNSKIMIDKYPLLNMFFFELDKFDTANTDYKVPVYVILDEYKRAFKIVDGVSSTLDYDVVKSVAPTEFCIILGTNERLSFTPSSSQSRAVGSNYDNALLAKKSKSSFLAGGYKYEYRKLVYSSDKESSIESKESEVRSTNKFICLRKSRFSNKTTYKRAEGWYRGDPEMLVYFNLAYLDKNEDVKMSKHELSFSAEYVYRKGWRRKRYLKDAWHDYITVFSDGAVLATNYNNIAVVLHAVEDDGQGQKIKISANVTLKKVFTGKIEYSPTLGGTQYNFGQTTVTLQDLIEREVNIGGFIMKFEQT